ncbi:MAG: hypothetical protein LQ346_005605 [Caloplaca aetnensis]|nr:MAG: hypothetical protein LQ346_005605 [Caloplaca aetnensis]
MLVLSHRNALFGFTFLFQTVLAIDPKHHAFLKRQGCANIDSQCSSVGTSLSDCIDYVCSSCTDVDPAISQCCELSTNLNIANCITENLNAGTSSSSGDITSDGESDSTTSFGSFDSASATFLTDDFASAATSSGFDAQSITGTAASPSTSVFVNPECSSLGSKIQACDSATPGFENYRLWDTQASCFCYEGSNFAPSSFDNYYSSCLDFLSTDNPAAYSILTVGTDEVVSTPCASMGDVRETSPASAQGGAVGGGSQNTRSTASPGGTVATANTALPTPTTSAARTVPSAAGGNVAGGSGAAGLPVKSALALFVSFAGLMYLL